MESVPVSSETVEMIVLVDVLIVAITSPGKIKPVEDGQHLVAVGRQADGLDQARPVGRLLVAMVVTTACVVRLTTEIPPPEPALAT